VAWSRFDLFVLGSLRFGGLLVLALTAWGLLALFGWGCVLLSSVLVTGLGWVVASVGRVGFCGPWRRRGQTAYSHPLVDRSGSGGNSPSPFRPTLPQGSSRRGTP